MKERESGLGRRVDFAAAAAPPTLVASPAAAPMASSTMISLLCCILAVIFVAASVRPAVKVCVAQPTTRVKDALSVPNNGVLWLSPCPRDCVLLLFVSVVGSSERSAKVVLLLRREKERTGNNKYGQHMQKIG